ncbi:MAG: ABC transporter permease, partial [Alphaproteobacteria bacterium]
MTILLAVAGLCAAAWAFRFAGQKLTNNRPFFRDMPFGVAFGYVFAAVALAGIIYIYVLARTLPPAEANKYFFFRLAVEGFIGFSIAAWLFREAGRRIGTRASRKLFRQMPLTAAFGIMIILAYAFVAIFAGWLAPHG